MKISSLLLPFQRRLFGEALIKAVLFALALSGSSVFFTSLLYHILILPTPKSVLFLVGGAVFALAFLASFFFRYFPNRKKTALRMDQMGLQERVSTMLAYENEKTDLARLQRQDTVEKVGKAKPGEMKFSLYKRHFLFPLISLCLAIVMVLLPYNIFSFSAFADDGKGQYEILVQELLDQLREAVRSSELDQDLKDGLESILDKTEDKLEATDSELKQVAILEQGKEEMEALLEKELTRIPIGKALQKYESTIEIGKAIEKGDGQAVSKAFSSIIEKLEQDRAHSRVLSQDILSALNDSGVEPEDALYSALKEFAEALGRLETESETFVSQMKSTCSEAEKEILAILEAQGKIQEMLDYLVGVIEEAKDKILEEEPEEIETDQTQTKDSEDGGKKEETENGTSENPKGNKPQGDQEEPEFGGDQEGPEVEVMTEPIFDPVEGSISYGKVFAAYYAEYLEALQAGAVPKDLQQIIDRYYSSLN